MKPPLRLSKITSPRFQHVLTRTRLLRPLDRHRNKKLILILGQAAHWLLLLYHRLGRLLATLQIFEEDREALKRQLDAPPRHHHHHHYLPWNPRSRDIQISE